MYAANLRLTLCLCLSLCLILIACRAEPAPVAEAVAKPAAEAVAKPVVEAVAKPAADAVPKPVEAPIFNPADPPAGYSRCQGGECHTVDGRILTYKQVMGEIGAKRAAGGIDAARLPPAPDDVGAVPAGASRTASGLAFRVLRPGTGTITPGPTSTVQVHYSGWTVDGEAFDSSVSRGRPAAFPLNRVIPGWQEAIQQMAEGERRRVWVPEALAYKGRAGGPPGMLVFDIELLKILAR